MPATQNLIYFDCRSLGSVNKQNIVEAYLNNDFEISPPSLYDIVKDIPDKMTTTSKKKAAITIDIIYGKSQVGHYRNTATKAYQPFCRIKIINNHNGAILASRGFIGSIPPEEITVGSEYLMKSSFRIGEYPYEDMRQFINRKIIQQKIYLKEGMTNENKMLWGCIISILVIASLVAIYFLVFT